MSEQTDKPDKMPSRGERWLGQLLAPVDGASLTLFRIGCGAILAWWAWDYLASGRVGYLYVQPRFHFTYYGFDWVQPWSGPWMHVHFLALALLALAIAVGCCYRVTSLLFAAGFTYVFLLDVTNYQNHYYLILLIAWVLPLLPLNRSVSADAALWPRLRSVVVPAWALWLLRFHIALPYFFGGVAKLDADWFAGQPMGQMLAAHADWPLVGPLLALPAAGLFFAWGGLLFDLAIVPLLLWRRSRAAAYVLCVLFHVLNSALFQIHVFPWFMIMATTLFFEPGWPRRLLGGAPLLVAAPQPASWSGLSRLTQLRLAAAALYCVFHVWWPLRHQVYGGNPSWTEQGHLFAWRMMVRGKTPVARYYVTDKASRESWVCDLRPYLNADQSARFPRDPALILQLAHFLAAEQRRTGRDVEVRVLALTSLNGRKPELLVDPTVDLAREPRGRVPCRWIAPQREPLAAEPWSLPVTQWESHLDLPPLPRVSHSSAALAADESTSPPGPTR